MQDDVETAGAVSTGRRLAAAQEVRQADAEHYGRAGYDTKERFASYWHQIDEIRRLRPANVLEIGKGSGFFSAYCSARGIAVTTVDVDPAVRPDLVASVTDLPCADESFDVAAAFQILEHLPYGQFAGALKELRRVSRGPVVISLPDSTRMWRYLFYIPKLGELSLMFPRPFHRPMKGVVSAQHYWEIGQRGYPAERIRGDIATAGLHIQRQYQVFEFPYHRFFVLAKQPPRA